MNQYPNVTKFMATKLITFTPDVDIYTAIDTMLRYKISGAPVVNAQKELVGILSEVDCLKLLVEPTYTEEPSKTGTVSDFMSPDVKTISSGETILDAAYIFVHEGLKRLPVMENGKLVGQISRHDVLRAIKKIRPHIRHVPDSWKVRMPGVRKFKKMEL